MQTLNKEIKLKKEKNEEINKEVEEFVKESMHSREYYEKNRNAYYQSIGRNISEGKKAEYFASLFIHKEYKFPLIKPDLKIYGPDKKTFEADLLYSKIDKKYWEIDKKNLDVHVKSCNLWLHSFCGDYSWTFEKKDPLFQKNDRQLVALVYLENTETDIAVVKTIIPFKLCVDFGIFKPPKLEKHREKKTCINYNDILNLDVDYEDILKL